MIEPIEQTYFDKCDVYRMDKVKQPNGSYKQQRVKLYADVSCAFSNGTRPSYSTIAELLGVEADVTNTVASKQKVYMNPSYDVKQGDQLILNRAGRLTTVIAGSTFVYDSHMTIEVEEVGVA